MRCQTALEASSEIPWAPAEHRQEGRKGTEGEIKRGEDKEEHMR